MSTAASIREEAGSHFYTFSGKPVYEVPKKDGSGMTKTTIAHARKMNLLPSVTTVLKLLNRPALTQWLIEQAVLSVLTTPRIANEPDDAFVRRVLSVDREQDKERDAAAELGTKIHSEIEAAIAGASISDYMGLFVEPVLKEIDRMGKLVWSERILVGDGYAGRCDLCLKGSEFIIVDYKTCKKLPKQAYDEHRLQLAAYAKASNVKPTRTANIYISTTEPGQIKVCENTDIDETFEAFNHLLQVWQWMNNYKPQPAEQEIGIIP